MYHLKLHSIVLSEQSTDAMKATMQGIVADNILPTYRKEHRNLSRKLTNTSLLRLCKILDAVAEEDYFDETFMWILVMTSSPML